MSTSKELLKRIEALENELEAVAAILQRVHPIGAVKGIGILECSAALAEITEDMPDHGGFRLDTERAAALAEEYPAYVSRPLCVTCDQPAYPGHIHCHDCNPDS